MSRLAPLATGLFGGLSVALVACGPAPEGPAELSDAAERFLPAPGARFEYVNPEDLEAEPLLLRVSEDGAAWSFRRGARWADAEDLGALTARLDDAGFWLGEQLLMPPRVSEGATGEGVEVVMLDSLELYYGLFPWVAVVETREGLLVGEQAFAEELGPAVFTVDGVRWEIAAYQ